MIVQFVMLIRAGTAPAMIASASIADATSNTSTRLLGELLIIVIRQVNANHTCVYIYIYIYIYIHTHMD